jgi:hypothetical protein
MSRISVCKLLFLAAASVCLLLPVPRANAQDASTAPASATSSQMVIYDVSKETTIQGTISTIETLRSGEFFGSHISVESSQGGVDAHLGAASVAKYLSLSQGQSVELVGMMVSVNGQNVFLARKLSSDGKTFTLRSTKGVPFRTLSLPRSLSGAQQNKGGL